MKEVIKSVWLIALCLFLWGAKTTEISAQQDKSGVSAQQTEKSGDKIYKVVEHLPYYVSKEPSVDTKAILEFISKHIKYPEDAWKIEKQGTVLCELVINKDGSFSDIRVYRGLYPSLDKEAVRVLSTFPKWKPGIQSGKNVRVQYTLPVIFRMRDMENK